MDYSNNENKSENNITHSIYISTDSNSLKEDLSTVNSLLLSIGKSLFGNLNLINESVSNHFTEIQSTLAATLNTLLQNNTSILSEIFSVFSSFQEYIDEIDAQYSPSGEVRTAFKNSGWPIAPSLPMSFHRYMVELDRKGKAKQAWRKIMGYYHKDNFYAMKEMVKSWEKVRAFQTRMPIIYDTLDAHCLGKYTLSIPGILPQIEGVLTEFALNNGIKIHCGSPEGISKKVLETQDITVISEAMSSVALECCNQLYKYVGFTKELKKNPNNRKVTRNTILHGISTNYATPTLSLKLFLNLDYLSGLEDRKKPQKGDE